MSMKLEWLGYRMVKNYDNMLSRFHPIPERYERTDRQTDGIPISISRVSVLTRDKNLWNGKVEDESERERITDYDCPLPW